MYKYNWITLLYTWNAYNIVNNYGGGGDLVAKSCLTLVTPRTVPARLFCPWDSPGKNIGVGWHFLLQLYSNIT